jgi:ariadne-1
LYETLEDRIKDVQDASEGGMSWIEARFMKNAVEELTRCRWTLKWTYAMAFYLKGGNAKSIFEDLQAWVSSIPTIILADPRLSFSLSVVPSYSYINRNLEKAVEELSQMLEEEIQQSTIKNLRMRMVDKTVSSSFIFLLLRVCLRLVLVLSGR